MKLVFNIACLYCRTANEELQIALGSVSLLTQTAEKFKHARAQVK